MADDQNAQDATDDTPGTNDTSNDNQNASGDAGTSNDTSDDTSGDVVTRADLEKALDRMKAADKRASTLENELKEIKRKEQSELENAKTDLQEVTKQRDALAKKVDEMALENAFLTDNKHTWHDPTDALRLMDREGVEIKDGSVNGLKQAIEKLAKAKPHLIKQVDGDENGSSAASGSANNGNRKGSGKTPKSDMSSRFPALRR